MFKIIAIETLEPKLATIEKRLFGENPSPEELAQENRYSSIMKVLKPKQKYYFYDGYVIRRGEIQRLKQFVPNDFYNEKNDNLPNLSVAAIVGENGQGKSSIIELLMRLINNVAFILRAGLDEKYQSHLVFVFDIFAKVYIEDTNDGNFYIIQQSGDIISFIDQVDSSQNWKLSFNDTIYNENRLENILQSRERLSRLFYSIVVNYSNYAFWPEEYHSEWFSEADAKKYGMKNTNDVCWFESLFHKNDAYQTPIVINPFRDFGKIDFRHEKNLLPERIYALLFNSSTKVSGILNGKSVAGFLLTLREGLIPAQKSMFESDDVRSIIRRNKIDAGDYSAFKRIDDLGFDILTSWGHCYGIDLLPKHTIERKQWKSESLDMRCAANYIVYKTIKIAYQYHIYDKFTDEIQNGYVENYIHELYKNNSHVTLKVRRCISYLIFKFYSNYGPKHIKGDNYMSVQDYQGWINHCINHQSNGLPQGRARVYHDCEPHKWIPNEFWPAPCYIPELLLESINSNDKNSIVVLGQRYIPFSSLSSGEKHLINIVSSVLYHVQNVASRWNMIEQIEERVRYRNICIMLDEAELYAHPKYQAKMLSYIINSLRGLNLSKDSITGIQILIATHSPFVLSDIPSCNILSIRDGKPDGNTQDILGKTFAANVYDILSHKFFMDSFVGEFARTKIEHLLSTIKKLDAKTISEDEFRKLSMEISVIGDDFLRTNIEERLNRAYKKDTSSPSYLELQKEVEELKEQLSNLKQGI